MMAISNEKSIVTDSIELGIEKGIEIGREKGIEIGREKGIEIGREKGIEIGLEKGRQDEKLAIAGNLLSVMDNHAIANITGLSLEIVQTLREQAPRRC